MLDFGAQVSTNNSNQSSAYQSNNLVINVGDGEQESDNTSRATNEQLAEQRYSKKDDMTASVGVGVGGGSGSGGEITQTKQEQSEPSLFEKFNSMKLEENVPMILAGLGVGVFALTLIASRSTIPAKNKKS